MAYGYRRFRSSRYSRYRFRRRMRPTYTRRRRIGGYRKKKVYDRNFVSKRLGTAKFGSETITLIPNPSASPGNISMQLDFSLAQVEEYMDYVNLYDQYKIRGVKVTFIPMANITDSTASQYASLIYTAYDFTGDTTPTLSEIRQNQYVKWSPYTKIHKRFFHPRPVVSDGAQKVGAQDWYPTEVNPKVIYRSLLVNFPNVPTVPTGDPIYRVEVKYYLSFRMTR